MNRSQRLAAVLVFCILVLYGAVHAAMVLL